MKKDEHISEEQLNAFVDGELDSEERNSLFDEAEQSEALDQRLCQQRKLKELVKHAYREVPEARRHPVGPRAPKSMFGLAVAASLFLAVGTLTGLLVHSFMDRSPESHTVAATGAQPAVASSENYILHVTSGNAEQMKAYATEKIKSDQHTAHTTNLVPLIYIGRDAEIISGQSGSLSDIAPTMLYLMGLEVPQEMTGKPLLKLQ